MDKNLAKQLSKKLKIPTSQIVRKEYEFVILKELFSGKLRDKIVFKGGTALRLAYGSPRFSDDLDFSSIKNIKTEDFLKTAVDITKINPNITLGETVKKINTLFALFKISDPSVSTNFSIKVEISTRKEILKEGKDYSPVVLKSLVSPISLIANTMAIEKILKDKLKIEPRRIRDIFDIWFIKQYLGEKNSKMDFSGFKKNEVKRELNKLLPTSYKSLLDEITKNI